MIPVSVADILNALDKLPEWLGLKRLPNRMAALEARVEALEKAAGKPAAKICPICETGTLKTIKVTPDANFAFAGVQSHLLQCTECPHSETRKVDPQRPTD